MPRKRRSSTFKKARIYTFIAEFGFATALLMFSFSTLTLTTGVSNLQEANIFDTRIAALETEQEKPTRQAVIEEASYDAALSILENTKFALRRKGFWYVIMAVCGLLLTPLFISKAMEIKERIAQMPKKEKEREEFSEINRYQLTKRSSKMGFGL